MALEQRIREKIRNEGYQVMGICHRLAVKQRTEWLTRNQWVSKPLLSLIISCLPRKNYSCDFCFLWTILFVAFFFMSCLHFRLRLKGLEFRDYGNRILKKVLEGTPLQSLSETIFVATNAQLFGKDINAIKAIITECEKIDWLIPIGD